MILTEGIKVIVLDKNAQSPSRPNQKQNKPLNKRTVRAYGENRLLSRHMGHRPLPLPKPGGPALPMWNPAAGPAIAMI